MYKISSRQKSILEYIARHIYNNGYPPSVREIASAVGLKSTSTVHAHLETLQDYGLLSKNPSQPRTIELLDKAHAYIPQFGSYANKDVIPVPILGNIAAGKPILAIENVEDSIPLPADFFKGGEHFILRIQGDSMIDAGIHSGDLGVIRQQSTAENGEIVAALLDNETTLKRFYKEKNNFRLQAENIHMEPIFTTEINIIGKLVALIRTF